LLHNNSFVGFYPINAIQKRNAHSYLADFEDELSLYADSARMIEYLNKWSCEDDLPQCMIKLSADFVAQTFWQHNDSRLTLAWIDDLNSANYRFPLTTFQLNETKSTLSTSTSVNGRYSNCRPAYYLANDANENTTTRVIGYFDELEKWCNADSGADKIKFVYPADGISFNTSDQLRSAYLTRLLRLRLSDFFYSTQNWQKLNIHESGLLPKFENQ